MEPFESVTGTGSVVVANVPITFTVPAGWANWGGGVFKGPMRYWAPSAAPGSRTQGNQYSGWRF